MNHFQAAESEAVPIDARFEIDTVLFVRSKIDDGSTVRSGNVVERRAVVGLLEIGEDGGLRPAALALSSGQHTAPYGQPAAQDLEFFLEEAELAGNVKNHEVGGVKDESLELVSPAV
jgi:hypothetical protein